MYYWIHGGFKGVMGYHNDLASEHRYLPDQLTTEMTNYGTPHCMARRKWSFDRMYVLASKS